MEFNAKKCHVLNLGKSMRRPQWNYRLGTEEVTRSAKEKDLGVTIQDSLSPEEHIDNIFRTTYNLLVNVKVAFHYMDREMMRKIITTLIRPKLEYAATVWSPHLKKHIRKLERIQRAATKLVPELENLPYSERLREMDLPTLEERRERGDLITIYKLLNGLEEVDKIDLMIPAGEGRENMRGHAMKLRKPRCMSDIKKYSFPYRAIDTWNGLKEEVVMAHSVSDLKNRLDKHRYRDRTPRV